MAASQHSTVASRIDLVQQVKSALKAETQKVNDLQISNKNLSEEAAALKSQVATLIATNNLLVSSLNLKQKQTQVDDTHSSNGDLTRQLETANIKVEDAYKKIHELESSLAAMGQEVKHLREENEELSWKLEETKQEIGDGGGNPEFFEDPNVCPNVHTKFIFGRTPLHLAAENDSVDEIWALLQKGADPNAKDGIGCTPLHRAASCHSDAGVTRLLLQKGADPNDRDNTGRTPLHFAANFNSNDEVTRLLLQKGADPNSKSNIGRTPLHFAANYNWNAEVTRLLLLKGADPSACDYTGHTPLHFAANCNSNVELTRLLLQYGADPNAKSKIGRTPLHFAANFSPNDELTRLLLQKGADPNARSNIGRTPLHFAANFNSNDEVTRLLLQKGADPDARSNIGRTPLHFAASFNANIEVTRLLLDKGADLNAKDDGGYTPFSLTLDTAKQSLMMKYGARAKGAI